MIDSGVVPDSREYAQRNAHEDGQKEGENGQAQSYRKSFRYHLYDRLLKKNGGPKITLYGFRKPHDVLGVDGFVQPEFLTDFREPLFRGKLVADQHPSRVPGNDTS